MVLGAAACCEFLAVATGGGKSTSAGAIAAKGSGVVAAVGEAAARRRRQDYLYRLGFQTGKGQACPVLGGPQHQPVAFKKTGQIRSMGTWPTADMQEQQDADKTQAEGEHRQDEEVEKRHGATVESDAEVADAENVRQGLEIQPAEKCSQQGNFRVNFLRKLSYSKVWVPQVLRPPKHQTVIIFDWDDTLLCTSFLTGICKGQAFPHTVTQCLSAIERISCELLEMALRLGHTFIITNAAEGWVEHSAAAYVPGILPVLRTVPVVSARSKFEPQYPGDVGMWKTQAFLEIQRQLDSQIIANLISIGDSNFEMDAVHAMGRQFSEALTKTIKFTPNPSPEELVKQLDLVAKKFERIVVRASNLQVGLERRGRGSEPNPACAT